MRLALGEAAKAARRGEVPVGAVVLAGRRVLARAANAREGTNDPTAHAEVLAIRRAAKATKSWRLSGCTLVVTLEPCIQCVGAALLARVQTVVFGTRDPKGGGLGSVADLRSPPGVNHRLEVVGGVLAEECADALRGFFESLRRRKRGRAP